MADVVAKATEPALAAIKLAWWGERLGEIDQGKVPAEPRLKAAAAHLLPRGITGEELAAIAPGWATLLDEWPDSSLIAERGAAIFRVAAGLLRAPEAGLANAGALYSTVDVARRTRNGGVLSDADEMGGPRFPRAVRPITALAALASRDLHRYARHGFEREATPGRAWTLLRHRLTGRIS